MAIRGYTDALSYRAGDKVTVFCDGPEQDVNVGLVRLVHSSDASTDVAVAWGGSGRHRLTQQRSCVGSFAVSAPTLLPTNFTLGTFLRVDEDSAPVDQAIWSISDAEGGELLSLMLRESRLEVAGSVAGATELVVRSHVWYYLAVTCRPDSVTVALLSCDPLRGESGQSIFLSGVARTSGPVTLVLAARRVEEVVESNTLVRGRAQDCLTGKIGAFTVFAGALDEDVVGSLADGRLSTDEAGSLVADWDLTPYSAGDDANRVRDRVSGAAVPLVNLPTQGVTGRFYDGSEVDYRLRPEHYAAVHFHRTDLSDVGWSPLVSASLPANLPSGVYAIQVSGSHGTDADTVPIFVVPRTGATTGRKVALLLPTNSYLAYANESLYDVDDLLKFTSADTIEVAPEDVERLANTSLGLSLYDTHPGGDGVVYSSTRRSIVNMRRGYRMWLVGGARGFSADMYLVQWLEAMGIDYDVLTDHEVHEGGIAALAPYRAVVSGTHPEYVSTQELDALEAYRDGGGGILYLGGNGWYWVTGVFEPGVVIEIRRGHAGILTWTSEPGEVTLVSGRQPGGLWKYRGRAPQRLVGVGMAAQGWGRSHPYYWNAVSRDERLQWMFEGVDEDPLGAYGLIMGGAAGDEIDRADYRLGTPHHAAIVATSRGHDNYYQRVPEELGTTLPSPNSPGGLDDPEVHADLVYFTTPGGGTVFSVGSMAWAGSLVVNEGANGVSRLTLNVLRRLTDGSGDSQLRQEIHAPSPR